MIIDRFWRFISHDLAIDLGTSNTLVMVRGQGIKIREPSVVARHKKTKEILAIGTRAKQMYGKTPSSIEAIRPLKDGVIADFDGTFAMLTHYIKRLHQSDRFIPYLPRPRVIIGIPSAVTEVERRAVHSAALSAGARQAFLVEEPMAAAIGAGLPVSDPTGIFIVDIGGGTTEISIISLGGIVIDRSLRIAGDEMDEAVVNFFRLKYSLLIGQATAETVKIEVGSAYPQTHAQVKETVVRGRDLETGLPKSVKVTSNEIREALSPILQEIVTTITDTIEEAPPELISEIVERGITICGGGALIPGIDKLVSEQTKIPAWIAQDPITCVVRGAGSLFENPELLHQIKITSGLK